MLILVALSGAQDVTCKDAPKGSGKGTIGFPGPRPKQPVVVYLERADAPAFTLPAEPLVIGQKDARFDPPFAVVVVGRKVGVFGGGGAEQRLDRGRPPDQIRVKGRQRAVCVFELLATAGVFRRARRARRDAIAPGSSSPASPRRTRPHTDPSWPARSAARRGNRP